MTLRKVAKELEQENQKNLNWKPIWPTSIIVKIGSLLANEFLKVAKISVEYTKEASVVVKTLSNTKETKEEPAFKHFYQIIPGTCNKVGMIAYHPALYDLILKQPLQVQPWLLPMIVSPRPWVTWTSGGYLQHRQEVVRIHNNPEHREYLAAADEANHLSIVLRSLDVLGMTPWTINKRIFQVASKMWNEGIEGPSMPAKLNLPAIEKPADYESNPEAKKKYKIANKKRTQDIQNNFSQRCDVNYKIEVAKAVSVFFT
jgi:DNA-directed RNA polymerase